MSLLEWMREQNRRGGKGSLDAGAPDPVNARPGVLLLLGAIGGGLIGGAVYFALRAEHPSRSLGGIAVYLLVSYFVRPRPDTSNVGFARGLIDHPFRWSDDFNRALVLLRVLLAPGRFAVGSLRDMFALAVGKRIELPRREEKVVWERKER